MEAEIDPEGGGLMKRKLKSDRGETLIELLASILIASLSVALVFGSIMASTQMDHQAQELDESYYATLSKAEKQAAGDQYEGGQPAGASVIIADTTIIADPTAAPSAPAAVIFYGGKSAFSYALDTTP